MDPRNYAYLDYNTHSNYDWSNVRGYQNISVSKIDESGNIKTDKTSWNKIVEINEDEFHHVLICQIDNG